MFQSWYNMVLLAAESQHVIWLRGLKLAAGGPKAREEAHLMVAEKMAAASQEAGRLFLGASADSVVSSYRKTVRANVRRLTK